MALERRRNDIETPEVISSVSDNINSEQEVQGKISCICTTEAESLQKICYSCSNVQNVSPVLSRQSPEVTYLSPILSKRLSPEQSPVLNKISITKSPIIGNYSSFRKRKRELTPPESATLTIEHSSPDSLFSQVSTSYYDINNDRERSESPCNISQMYTPCSQRLHQIEIVSSDDETNTPTSLVSKRLFTNPTEDSVSIEPVCSDDEMKDSLISFSDCSCSLSSASDNLVVKNIKRKRYKKNGLARRLQKCITEKNSSTAMWLHEQQFSKYCSDFDKSFLLKINDFSMEYSNFVIHCSNEEDNDSCIVIIHVNNVSSFVPCKNAKFRLYPPYITKQVNYNSELLKVFCNVSRIKMCDATDQ